MTSVYLFVIGYLVAAAALFVFALRMRRVFLLERSKLFRFIYIGCGLLGLALVLYAACYFVLNRVQLTILNEVADGVLFAGLFTVARFPTNFWGGIWNTRWLIDWTQRILLLVILLTVGESVVELVYGFRPLCELVNGTVFADHAPIYYNVSKVGIILLAGVSAGLTNVYYGAAQHSLRSYLLGFGMVVTTIGGAVTVFSFDERTAPIGVSIYLLGGTLLLGGVITPRKESTPAQTSFPRDHSNVQ